MALSVAVTGLLVAYLSRIARRTRNLIVRADALHYKSDLFSNLAVIASLILVEFTGFAAIDAVFGIVISGYIAVSAINLMKESVGVLLDRALEPEITAQIEEIIRSRPQIASYHGLATRRSANICYVVVHLVFNREISLYDAHKISDEIEAAIRAKYGEFEWQITTHLDPCDDQNGSCECSIKGKI